MPLRGVGLVLTIGAAACVFGFLGGLAQRCYMQSRSRSRARRDAARPWPAPSPDIELGPMGRRNVVWVDGELAVQVGWGRVWSRDAEADADAANGRQERGGMGWTTV